MKEIQTKKNNFSFLFNASLAAFGTYFCMYAFRKPFAVATFEGIKAFGIDYKTCLIIAQVLGYMFSKFLGIKIIGELKPTQRIYYLLGLISISEIFLILFAIIPAPYNIFCLFFNGLPLGLIWGIVFSYLEGRKHTEILGVILSSSFVVSSGIVKSAGLFVMNILGFSEMWMPAITGALFVIPLFIFSNQLEKVPLPSKEDIQLRSERLPLDKKERWKIISKYFFILSIWVVFYISLTILRDFRDNFSRELWEDIGYKGDISVYSTSEMIVSFLVLIILSFTFYIKDNTKALIFYQKLLLGGAFLIGLSTYLFEKQYLNSYLWMVVSGFGLYICYIPFNCLLFDRFVGAFKIKGNAGFLIYFADSFGYLGTVFALFFKNLGYQNSSWLEFFINQSYYIAAIGTITTLASIAYLKLEKKSKNKQMINLNTTINISTE